MVAGPVPQTNLSLTRKNYSGMVTVNLRNKRRTLGAIRPDRLSTDTSRGIRPVGPAKAGQLETPGETGTTTCPRLAHMPHINLTTNYYTRREACIRVM
jgi:hypothetical protein